MGKKSQRERAEQIRSMDQIGQHWDKSPYVAERVIRSALGRRKPKPRVHWPAAIITGVVFLGFIVAHWLH